MSGTSILGQIYFDEDSVWFVDPSDSTKRFKVNLGLVTPGNTITLNVPDNDWIGGIGTGSSVKADDILEGDAAVNIGTTSGNMTFSVPSGQKIDNTIDGTIETSLTAGTTTLKSGSSYTITHGATADSQDLTISQTGSFDASLIIQNTQGTGEDAVSIISDTGGINIDPALTSGLKMCSNINIYEITVNTTDNTADQEIWTLDLGTLQAIYHVKVTLTGQDYTNSKYASYDLTTSFNHDGGTTLTRMAPPTKSSIGDTTEICLSGNVNLQVKSATDNVQIEVTPGTNVTIQWRGYVTITSNTYTP